MRLALTVVSPAARRQADVLLEADPATPVATVAQQLDRFLHAGLATSPAPAGRRRPARRGPGRPRAGLPRAAIPRAGRAVRRSGAGAAGPGAGRVAVSGRAA